MNKRSICSLALGGALLPVGAAAVAEAPPSDVAQGASAVQATAKNTVASFLDAADGTGPTGADGAETEVSGTGPALAGGTRGRAPERAARLTTGHAPTDALPIRGRRGAE